MTPRPSEWGPPFRFKPEDLESLFVVLHEQAYKIIGPTVNDDAIVLGELNSTADLPVGWTDEQSGGSYRLARHSRPEFFHFASGPHSLKQYLHPPSVCLWTASRNGHGFEIMEKVQEAGKLAFVGVRACDLHALAILDKVFKAGPLPDSSYALRRSQLLVIAVNCTSPGGTCFCESMKCGPQVDEGFDLVLTEIEDEGRHFFVGQAGSESGRTIAAKIPQEEASSTDLERVETMLNDARTRMGRRLDTSDLKKQLYRSYDHPRWEETAERCLNCGNCTMVCPTCFCNTMEDVTDLSGVRAERWRKWDSCFTTDFSYIHGGSIRSSAKSRYRQWLIHKLATWVDQFGTFGCVGCGRCITWCPVGIDLTEETAAILESNSTSTPGMK
ncbi:MAG: 4Fe-4S dicluster domain-containing protein [Acidobacteriia bacterium]|nr:4Fe-4S dicluster domain-containing protein [Terriglobia bacterium]